MDDEQSRTAVPPRETHVLVVAEVRLYREGLATSLASRKNLTLAGTAANAEEAFAVVASTKPDVVVLDMATRDSLDIVRTIRRDAPTIKIIAFAVQELDREVLACAEAGVAGYVPSDGSTDELVAMIESVMRGELVCSPRMVATLFRRLATLAGAASEQLDPVRLTRRERQIVALLDAGLSNKEIAQRLVIEIATVKNHVHNILEKLHVTSRAEAAASMRRALTTRPSRVTMPTQP